MTKIAMEAMISILFFMMLGVGPALMLYRNSTDMALATAPAIGLILTTIIGSCLILFDLPILTWAYTWLIVGSMASLSIAAYQLKKHAYSLINTQYLLLGILLVSFILLLPMMYGGLSFTVLRGNAVDTFNYISLAGYLQHEPYSWGQSADVETLLNKHASYITARDLLPTRWSTSMLLGWFSTITKTSIQEFEYAFTVIFFILSYGCSYTLCKQAGFKNSYIILTSIAICTGFWAQFVIDIRAMSHITALPLVILYIAVIERIENDKPNWKFQILLGMLITAITLLYIEILPLIALGTFLFFIVSLFQKKQTLFQIVRNYALASFVSITTLCMTSNKYLANFLMNQLHYANHIKNNWHTFYFSWLYKHPLLSFWGLLPLHSGFIKILFTIISIILTLCMAYLLFSSLCKTSNSPSQRLIAAIIVALVMEVLYLIFNEQLWAAGKAVSYGYPFIIFFMALTLLQHSERPMRIPSIGKYLILTFLIIQCSFGLLRIEKSNSSDIYFAQKISSPFDYHRHDFNIQAMTEALKASKATSVGLMMSNELVKQYLENVWGWDLKVIDVFSDAFSKTKKSELPEYIMTDLQDTALKEYTMLEKNSEYMLIKLNSNSSIKQISAGIFIYPDKWLKLNQKITFPVAIIRKIPGATLRLKGNLFPKYFNGPVDLTLKINNHHTQHKVVYPGKFEWNIPLEKLSEADNKLDFFFTSNKILAENLDTRSLAVHMDSVMIVDHSWRTAG